MLSFSQTFSILLNPAAKLCRNGLPVFRGATEVFCICLVVLVLSGCAIKRDGYDVPQVALPAQYKNSNSVNAVAATPSPKDPNSLPAKPRAPQDANLVEWWRSFGNPELVELVDRGLANNSDIRIAALRLAQAKARADQAGAGRLPTLSTNIGEAMGSVPVGTSAASRTSQKSYQASMRGNWRADIWGEQSSLADSAKFQLWQSAFERDNVQRNMVATIADLYVEFLSLNDRLRVARKTEAALSGMLAAVEARVDVDDATLIDLDQQKMATLAARSAIHILEKQREDALTDIAFLVGTVPGALKLPDDGLDTLYLPADVPMLPSSLLLRRPDVRMAEARLLAADANVDVARARLLPPLDLSAQVGYSGLSMAQLFQPSTLFWNVIANVTASIFDGGKLASEKENAQAIHEEMVEAYARTIYQAVKEVENSLVAIRLNGQRLDSQQKITDSARRIWDSSADVYTIGGIDRLALLDAERSYQRSLDEYQQIKMGYYREYINLFQALGGGVSFGEQLPGKGLRPTLANGDTSDSDPLAEPKKDLITSGIDWIESSSPENFWQVELPGMYYRSTIDATWRDLRTRYPKLMESRSIHPRLQGQIEGSAEGQVSWYRLYVGKFATPEAAHELCATLQANFQRCRVISSHSDETVADPHLPKEKETPIEPAGADVVRGTDMLAAAIPSKPAAGRTTDEPEMSANQALTGNSLMAKDK
jgi:NodT family efflux transporter outer membrane factor (OMF) lipoprotein